MKQRNGIIASLYNFQKHKQMVNEKNLAKAKKHIASLAMNTTAILIASVDGDRKVTVQPYGADDAVGEIYLSIYSNVKRLVDNGTLNPEERPAVDLSNHTNEEGE